MAFLRCYENRQSLLRQAPWPSPCQPQTLAADARLPDGLLEMPGKELSPHRSWSSPCQPRTLATDARLPGGHFEMPRKELARHGSQPSLCWHQPPKASMLLIHGRKKMPSRALNGRWRQFHRGPRGASAELNLKTGSTARRHIRA